MLKKWAAFILCVIAVFSLPSCGVPRQPEASNTGKVRVSVTFHALKEFVLAVGGDKVDVSTIIPSGTEPHDFEPKAQDLVGLGQAQVFVYNGLGMETWADSAVTAAGNKNLIVAEAAKGITPISNKNGAGDHGQYDPHVWLSLKGAQLEAKNIAAALIQADPSNQAYYEARCTQFIAQLEALYTEYSAKLKTVSRKSFVTGHAAFAYLCRDFGLIQNSVGDVFAEGEPSAQQLAALVDYCKANRVTTIFVEEAVSPDISQTLASEVGASVQAIDTLENSSGQETYLDRMSENLKNIYDSLK
ncbi:MAG: metal ABC transporter substrate-binding protein [Oscillospiraceae bacterium]|nr:metal ABC transporter substrate-binding protein [Oscillospiraceae bacterium]